MHMDDRPPAEGRDGGSRLRDPGPRALHEGLAQRMAGPRVGAPTALLLALAIAGALAGEPLAGETNFSVDAAALPSGRNFH